MVLKRVRQTLTSALSLVVFVTNVVCVHSTETNFWESRRKANQMWASALPSAHSVSFNGSAIRSQSLTQLGVSPMKMAERPELKILHSLPHHLGHISKVSLPSSPSNRIVIHIQDIHQNQEAQTNIGLTIEHLLKKHQIDAIGLEGAFEPLPIAKFRSFPYQGSLKNISDFLFERKEMSGALHAVMVSESKVPMVVGVDDQAHYNANVVAYQESSRMQSKVKKALANEVVENESNKKSTFNSSLYSFDQKVQRMRSGDLSLGDFLRDVAPSGSEQPNISNYLEALKLEQTMNFNRAEQERSVVLEKLSSTLSAEQTNELLSVALSFKSGNLKPSEFYRYVEGLCRSSTIDLTRYPAMRTYLRYIALTDSINAEALFNETKSLEEDIYRQLTKTGEEKVLVERSRQLYLTGKLVDFSLTRTEWNEFRNLTALTLALSPRGEGIDLEGFRRFYEQAEIRDRKMASGLLKGTSILVTGGFHADGIEKELLQNGTTVVRFVPKLTRVSDEDSAYLSVFNREKTPLENLFKGDKLFLSEKIMTPAAQVRQTALMGADAIERKLASPEQAEAATKNLLNDQVDIDYSTDGTLVTGSIVDSQSKERISFEFQRKNGKPIAMMASTVRLFSGNLNLAARFAYLVEEIIFSGVYLTLLPWLVGEPLIGIALFVTSVVHFGLGHRRLYRFNPETGKVENKGLAQWRHTFLFMGLGGFFRIGFLGAFFLPWYAALPALALAFFLHWSYNLLAMRYGWILATTGDEPAIDEIQVFNQAFMAGGVRNASKEILKVSDEDKRSIYRKPDQKTIFAILKKSKVTNISMNIALVIANKLNQSKTPKESTPKVSTGAKPGKLETFDIETENGPLHLIITAGFPMDLREEAKIFFAKSGLYGNVRLIAGAKEEVLHGENEVRVEFDSKKILTEEFLVKFADKKAIAAFMRMRPVLSAFSHLIRSNFKDLSKLWAFGDNLTQVDDQDHWIKLMDQIQQSLDQFNGPQPVAHSMKVQLILQDINYFWFSHNDLLLFETAAMDGEIADDYPWKLNTVHIKKKITNFSIENQNVPIIYGKGLFAPLVDINDVLWYGAGYLLINGDVTEYSYHLNRNSKLLDLIPNSDTANPLYNLSRKNTDFLFHTYGEYVASLQLQTHLIGGVYNLRNHNLTKKAFFDKDANIRTTDEFILEMIGIFFNENGLLQDFIRRHYFSDPLTRPEPLLYLDLIKSVATSLSTATSSPSPKLVLSQWITLLDDNTRNPDLGQIICLAMLGGYFKPNLIEGFSIEKIAELDWIAIANDIGSKSEDELREGLSSLYKREIKSPLISIPISADEILRSVGFTPADPPGTPKKEKPVFHWGTIPETARPAFEKIFVASKLKGPFHFIRSNQLGIEVLKRDNVLVRYRPELLDTSEKMAQQLKEFLLTDKQIAQLPLLRSIYKGFDLLVSSNLRDFSGLEKIADDLPEKQQWRDYFAKTIEQAKSLPDGPIAHLEFLEEIATWINEIILHKHDLHLFKRHQFDYKSSSEFLENISAGAILRKTYNTFVIRNFDSPLDKDAIATFHPRWGSVVSDTRTRQSVNYTKDLKPEDIDDSPDSLFSLFIRATIPLRTSASAEEKIISHSLIEIEQRAFLSKTLEKITGQTYFGHAFAATYVNPFTEKLLSKRDDALLNRILNSEELRYNAYMIDLLQNAIAMIPEFLTSGALGPDPAYVVQNLIGSTLLRADTMPTSYDRIIFYLLGLELGYMDEPMTIKKLTDTNVNYWKYLLKRLIETPAPQLRNAFTAIYEREFDVSLRDFAKSLNMEDKLVQKDQVPAATPDKVETEKIINSTLSGSGVKIVYQMAERFPESVINGFVYVAPPGLAQKYVFKKGRKLDVRSGPDFSIEMTLTDDFIADLLDHPDSSTTPQYIPLLVLVAGKYNELKGQQYAPLESDILNAITAWYKSPELNDYSRLYRFADRLTPIERIAWGVMIDQLKIEVKNWKEDHPNEIVYQRTINFLNDAWFIKRHLLLDSPGNVYYPIPKEGYRYLYLCRIETFLGEIDYEGTDIPLFNVHPVSGSTPPEADSIWHAIGKIAVYGQTLGRRSATINNYIANGSKAGSSYKAKPTLNLLKRLHSMLITRYGENYETIAGQYNAMQSIATGVFQLDLEQRSFRTFAQTSDADEFANAFFTKELKNQETKSIIESNLLAGLSHVERTRKIFTVREAMKGIAVGAMGADPHLIIMDFLLSLDETGNGDLSSNSRGAIGLYLLEKSLRGASVIKLGKTIDAAELADVVNLLINGSTKEGLTTVFKEIAEQELELTLPVVEFENLELLSRDITLKNNIEVRQKLTAYFPKLAYDDIPAEIQHLIGGFKELNELGSSFLVQLGSEFSITHHEHEIVITLDKDNMDPKQVETQMMNALADRELNAQFNLLKPLFAMLNEWGEKNFDRRVIDEFGHRFDRENAAHWSSVADKLVQFATVNSSIAPKELVAVAPYFLNAIWFQPRGFYLYSTSSDQDTAKPLSEFTVAKVKKLNRPFVSNNNNFQVLVGTNFLGKGVNTPTFRLSGGSTARAGVVLFNQALWKKSIEKEKSLADSIITHDEMPTSLADRTHDEIILELVNKHGIENYLKMAMSVVFMHSFRSYIDFDYLGHPSQGPTDPASRIQKWIKPDGFLTSTILKSATFTAGLSVNDVVNALTELSKRLSFAGQSNGSKMAVIRWLTTISGPPNVSIPSLMGLYLLMAYLQLPFTPASALSDDQLKSLIDTVSSMESDKLADIFKTIYEKEFKTSEFKFQADMPQLIEETLETIGMPAKTEPVKSNVPKPKQEAPIKIDFGPETRPIVPKSVQEKITRYLTSVPLADIVKFSNTAKNGDVSIQYSKRNELSISVAPNYFNVKGQDKIDDAANRLINELKSAERSLIHEKYNQLLPQLIVTIANFNDSNFEDFSKLEPFLDYLPSSEKAAWLAFINVLKKNLEKIKDDSASTEETYQRFMRQVSSFFERWGLRLITPNSATYSPAHRPRFRFAFILKNAGALKFPDSSVKFQYLDLSDDDLADQESTSESLISNTVIIYPQLQMNLIETSEKAFEEFKKEIKRKTTMQVPPLIQAFERIFKRLRAKRNQKGVQSVLKRYEMDFRIFNHKDQEFTRKSTDLGITFPNIEGFPDLFYTHNIKGRLKERIDNAPTSELRKNLLEKAHTLSAQLAAAISSEVPSLFLLNMLGYPEKKATSIRSGNALGLWLYGDKLGIKEPLTEPLKATTQQALTIKAIIDSDFSEEQIRETLREIYLENFINPLEPSTLKQDGDYWVIPEEEAETKTDEIAPELLSMPTDVTSESGIGFDFGPKNLPVVHPSLHPYLIKYFESIALGQKYVFKTLDKKSKEDLTATYLDGHVVEISVSNRFLSNVMASAKEPEKRSALIISEFEKHLSYLQDKKYRPLSYLFLGGLTDVFKSDFTDYSKLEKAAEFLPVFDKEPWLNLIGNIKEDIDRRKTMPDFKKTEGTHRIGYALNHSWFYSRHLVCLPDFQQDNDGKNHAVRELFRISKTIGFLDFDEKRTPIVQLVHLNGLGKQTQLMVLGSNRIIGVFPQTIGDDFKAWEKIVQTSKGKLAKPFLELRKKLKATYANPSQAIMDFSILIMSMGQRDYEFLLKKENTDVLMPSILADSFKKNKLKSGELNEIYTKVSQQDTDTNNQYGLLGKYLILSAELAAGIKASSPFLLIHEWSGRVINNQITNSTTGGIGLFLLVQELGIAKLSLDAMTEFETEEAADWLMKIFNTPEDRIREALQAIYDRNFTLPVEDLPITYLSQPEKLLKVAPQPKTNGVHQPKPPVKSTTPKPAPRHDQEDLDLINEMYPTADDQAALIEKFSGVNILMARSLKVSNEAIAAWVEEDPKRAELIKNARLNPSDETMGELIDETKGDYVKMGEFLDWPAKDIETWMGKPVHRAFKEYAASLNGHGKNGRANGNGKADSKPEEDKPALIAEVDDRLAQMNFATEDLKMVFIESNAGRAGKMAIETGLPRNAVEAWLEAVPQRVQKAVEIRKFYPGFKELEHLIDHYRGNRAAIARFCEVDGKQVDQWIDVDAPESLRDMAKKIKKRTPTPKSMRKMILDFMGDLNQIADYLEMSLDKLLKLLKKKPYAGLEVFANGLRSSKNSSEYADQNPDVMEALALLVGDRELGDDLKEVQEEFLEYMTLFHDLNPTEAKDIVVSVLEGLKGTGGRKKYEEVFLSDFEVVPDLPSPWRWKNHSTEDDMVRIFGSVPTGTQFKHVIVTGVTGQYHKRIKVNPTDGTFMVTLPLRFRGRTNEFNFYAVDDSDPLHLKKSQSIPILIDHSGASLSKREAALRLYAIREDKLNEINNNPGYRRDIVQKIKERNLLGDFTYDEDKGFEILDKKLEEASGAERDFLERIKKKFLLVKEMKLPQLKKKYRLYFFQKWGVYEMAQLYRMRKWNEKENKYEGPLGVILAWDPGLGKTLTVEVLLEYLKLNATVVAPSPVVSTWSEQAEFFLDPNLHVLTGSHKERDQKLPLLTNRIKVTNAEYVALNMTDQRAAALRTDALVSDEAHMLINDSQRSRGFERIAFPKNGKKPFLVLMTATPVEKPSDIPKICRWVSAIEDALPPEHLALAEGFGDNTDISGTDMRILHVWLNKYLLRLTKNHVFQEYDDTKSLDHQSHRLPKKRHLPSIKWKLTAEHMDSILRLFTNFCGMPTNYLSRLALLQQIQNRKSNGVSPKLEALYDDVKKTLDENLPTNPNYKIMIMVREKKDVEAIYDRLAEFGPRLYYGGRLLEKNKDGFIMAEEKILYFQFDKRSGRYLIDRTTGKPKVIKKKKGVPMLAVDYERLVYLNSSNSPIIITSYATASEGVNLPSDKLYKYDRPKTDRERRQADNRIHRIDTTNKRLYTDYLDMEAEYPEEYLATLPGMVVQTFFAVGTYDKVQTEILNEARKLIDRLVDWRHTKEELKWTYDMLRQKMPWIFHEKKASKAPEPVQAAPVIEEPSQPVTTPEPELATVEEVKSDTLRTIESVKVVMRRNKSNAEIDRQAADWLKGRVFEQMVGLYLSLNQPVYYQGRIALPKQTPNHRRIDFFHLNDAKVAHHLVEIKWANSDDELTKTFKAYLESTVNEYNTADSNGQDHIHISKDAVIEMIVHRKLEGIEKFLKRQGNPNLRYVTFEERMKLDNAVEEIQTLFTKIEAAIAKVAADATLDRPAILRSWERLFYNLRMAGLDQSKTIDNLKSALDFVHSSHDTHNEIPLAFLDDNSLPKDLIKSDEYMYQRKDGTPTIRHYESNGSKLEAEARKWLEQYLLEEYNDAHPVDEQLTDYDKAIVEPWFQENLFNYWADDSFDNYKECLLLMREKLAHAARIQELEGKLSSLTGGDEARKKAMEEKVLGASLIGFIWNPVITWINKRNFSEWTVAALVILMIAIEELFFAGFLMQMLPWALATWGHLDPATINSIRPVLYISGSLLFGLLHDKVITLQGSKISIDSKSTIRQKLGFAGWGALFRFSYALSFLFPAVDVGAALLNSIIVHAIYEFTLATRSADQIAEMILNRGEQTANGGISRQIWTRILRSEQIDQQARYLDGRGLLRSSRLSDRFYAQVTSIFNRPAEIERVVRFNQTNGWNWKNWQTALLGFFFNSESPIAIAEKVSGKHLVMTATKRDLAFINKVFAVLPPGTKLYVITEDKESFEPFETQSDGRMKVFSWNKEENQLLAAESRPTLRLAALEPAIAALVAEEKLSVDDFMLGIPEGWRVDGSGLSSMNHSYLSEIEIIWLNSIWAIPTTIVDLERLYELSILLGRQA